jgi:23S rRNA pseudouridine2605 synthase
VGEAVEGERIAKVLARAGLCSRREAERWIIAGRVSVDGHKLSSPAVNVGAGAHVTVDGKPVAGADPAQLWRYHKPAGLVTSHRDSQGRPTVFERLPESLPRVISVGRLDLTSEGLLLLTNAGDLARRLERPENGWTRRYRVRVFGAVDEAALARLADGLRVGEVDYGPLDAALDRRQGRNAWLTVSLKEGRNREVRRVMEHLNLTVNRLIRIAFGPFQLGGLRRGAVDEIRGKVLREQLGSGTVLS